MWTTISDFPNYEVHSNGQVRSLKTGKLLKPQINRNRGGYLYISLCNNGSVKRKALHRLVAETFLPNPNNLPEVNHKTGDKNKCAVTDLEWCTSQYNTQHAFALGLITTTSNKPILQYSKTGVLLKEYPSINAATAELGIARQLISNVLRKNKKSTHGFVFVYKEVVL